MSRTKKLMEALAASEAKQVLSETTVHAEGDKVVISKNDGTTEEFVPNGQTAEEVVEKFNSIFRHSEGRAWQWLRKLKTKPAEDTTNESVVNEEEDTTTECPFHNILADLLNKENVTVQDYEAAIIKFNEAQEIPDEKRARIIEILNHAKDEELEHVNELQLADNILKGEDQPAEPEGEANAEAPVEEPLPPAEPEEEVELEFESIKEALTEEDEVFKILAKKEFGSFDEVEALFKEKGFEVTDVYREGDGFNLNLRKDGVEYFIPFISCKDKFCATLDNSANLDQPLEEGLGNWIAAKVARFVNKGNAVDARKEFLDNLRKKLGDAVKVELKGDNILVTPKEDFLVSLNVPVDSKGAHFGEIKAVDLKPAELRDAVKAAVDELNAVPETPAPAEETPEPEAEKDEFVSTGNEEIDEFIKFQLAGKVPQDKIKGFVAKMFPDFKEEIKFN